MNVKQKQCLLEYLGYFAEENSKNVNNIDGIWGAKSKAATKAFQEDYGLEPDGIFGPDTEARILQVVATGEEPIDDGKWWEEIKYFTRDEFKCKCGKHCDGFPAEPKELLIRTADRVRAHFGAAAIVSSGVRCFTHNASVGGVSNSRHLSGKAMDFCVSGKTAAQVLAYVQQQPGIRYAYAIDRSYVHMDVE